MNGQWATAPHTLNGRSQAECPKAFDKGARQGMIWTQERNLQRDMTAVRTLIRFKDLDVGCNTDHMHSLFRWAWCIVNTRSLYFVPPGTDPPRDANEAMVLCPGIDLFNHTDQEGCHVTSDAAGFKATANRAYDAGEEMFVSYGPHSNDTLLTEYGFLLDSNTHDATPLDDLITPELTTSQTNTLQDNGYLGDYLLGPDGPCYRTQVVARIGSMAMRTWKQFIAGKQADQPEEDKLRLSVSLAAKTPKTDATHQIYGWIATLEQEVETSLASLTSMTEKQVIDLFADDEDPPHQLDPEQQQQQRAHIATTSHALILQRWKQIWGLMSNGTC